MNMRKLGPVVEATVGYAADRYGRGIAYLAIKRSEHAAPLLLRASFLVKRYQGLGEREVGYAALAKASELLRERNVQRARFRVADPELVSDLMKHREVPPALMFPYVKLGCRINQFAEFQIEVASTEDLAARARAELALHIAA